MSFKKVLVIDKSNTINWEILRQEYLSSCYCTSVTTDLETYIEVEAPEEECMLSLCNDLYTLGFKEQLDRLR